MGVWKAFLRWIGAWMAKRLYRRFERAFLRLIADQIFRRASAQALEIDTGKLDRLDAAELDVFWRAWSVRFFGVAPPTPPS